MNLNLPIFPFLLPMVFGLGALIATPQQRRLLAIVVAMISLLSLAALTAHFWAQGMQDYLIGGWPSQLGIVYRVDAATLLILGVIQLIAWGHLSRWFTYTEAYIPSSQQGLLLALYGLCVMGMSGMVLSHDVFHIFVCLEIMSLTSYALLAAAGTEAAIRSAFYYLILGSLGGVFYLLGVGILYLHTGTLNMTDMAAHLLGLSYLHSVQAGVALLSVGLLIKLGVFPVYRWLIQAYRTTAAEILPFLAVLVSTVNIVVFLRFSQTLLPELTASPGGRMMIELLGGGTLLTGCAVMYMRPYLRDILVGSSLLHYGMILLATTIDHVDGYTVAWFECSSHAITKFLLLSGLLWLARAPLATLADIRGAARHMPILGGLITVALASQMGLPLTVGFVSKWQWLLLMIQHQRWHVFALGVVGSLVGLLVYGRLFESLYAKNAEAQNTQRMPKIMMVMMILGTGVLLVAGFYGEWVFRLVHIAIRGMTP